MSDTSAPVYKKAKRRGLNRIKEVRNFIIGLRRQWLVKVWGMDIHPTVQLSMSAKLDRTFPEGVHIGAHTMVAFEARIMAHDRTRGMYTHTRIGKNCFIGGRSLILPGIEIGDNSVIGAGTVVTKSVPPRSLVVGNPGKIIRSDIEVIEYGRFASADATESRLVDEGIA